MKKELFRFLKEYSTDALVIDKLIVSSYLRANNYQNVKNEHISSLIINENEDDFSNLNLFESKFRIDSLEKVIEAFEFVISPEDKVVSGAVYTPAKIRKFIVNNIFSNFENLRNKTICDPSCGCSGFLFTAIQELKKSTGKTYKNIIEQNIYGLDIKDYAVERSKILLTLLAIENGEDHKRMKFNFFVGNALSNDWNLRLKSFKGFDIVIGNPPYVCSRNIDSESKELLKQWQVTSTGHPDLYIPFFELGMELLKPNGFLGYITMNSFFKSLNGRALRRYFNEKSYNFKIVDFGSYQVFSSNNTYTCICLIQKCKSKELHYVSVDKGSLEKLSFQRIPYKVLDNRNGWNLKNTNLIHKIENTGKSFGSLFKTSSGVATLKNNVYIFNSILEDSDYYYINKSTPIEKSVCREIINTNKLTKVNDIRSLKKKIIFPYYIKNTSPIVIPENEFKTKYPKAYLYLFSKKEELALRDKGKGKYAEWFAFGRNQSLEQFKYKMFFPHIALSSPNFILNDDENLLFYNGLSLLSNDLKEMKLAQKIMSSRLFWYYIESTSKPYGAGYLSLSKNYIKSFGIYNFSEKEIDWLINENDQSLINCFIEEKYNVKL